MKVILIASLLFALAHAQGRPGVGPTPQDWGYVTVRPQAHLFWWLQHTKANVTHYTERPLVIWLQGGPGGSGTGFGNFAEIGPLDENLKPRNTTWLNQVNLLFVDNPVGTGFSYVESTAALTRTNAQIAEDFLVLLKAIYNKLPELANVPLYIFSESYGGKMTVDIALRLDKAIKAGELRAHFVGVGLGDSWIDPVAITLTWGRYLYALGIVDEAGQKRIDATALLAKEAFDSRRYTQSTDYWARTENVVQEVGARVDFYNVLTRIRLASLMSLRERLIKPDVSQDTKINNIMNGLVKKTLNINVTWGAQSGRVFSALAEDFMKPVTQSTELLLNTTNIKVAVYNGQLDLIVDTIGTVEWVNALKFPQAAAYKLAPRRYFLVNNTVEGFYKKAGNLAMYWVNRAGHMVPADNPAGMHYILNDVITDL